MYVIMHLCMYVCMHVCMYVCMYFLFTAQYLYNSFELWRKHKAIEINYPDLFEKKEKAKWTLVCVFMCVLMFIHSVS